MNAFAAHDLDFPGAGVRLHWLSSDAATKSASQPTLIFLHFFGGSSRTWGPVMERLADGHSCLALDLRGYGDSILTENANVEANYALDLMAADVTALLSHLGLRRYTLVGHSMGGKVALAFAASYGHPPGLEKLILVAPSPATPEPMPDKERTRLLAGQGSPAAARETLGQITAHPLPPALENLAVEDECRVYPAAWRQWLERSSRVDISARLSRIQVPVYLLAGDKDTNITPRLLRREVADYLPKTFAHDPETVPNAAHLLPLDAPEAVAKFISRIADSAVQSAVD